MICVDPGSFIPLAFSLKGQNFAIKIINVN